MLLFAGRMFVAAAVLSISFLRRRPRSISELIMADDEFVIAVYEFESNFGLFMFVLAVSSFNCFDDGDVDRLIISWCSSFNNTELLMFSLGFVSDVSIL